MKCIILLGVIGCLLLTVKSADDGDWVDPFRLPIPFNVHSFYAGYLNISAVKAFYYVYTHSQSNPSKDPLVIMISHGPGCSSLHSYLYTKGEFVFVKNTSDFRHNSNNWNREANVLFIQGPAGVGFSYGQDTVQSDQSVTKDYLDAVLKFYQKFPELKDQTMYLTGMQYAGVVAPRIALSIIEHNRDPETAAWRRINLGGMLLLNPCTLGDECNQHFQFTSYTIKSLRNNYFLSKEQYDQYLTHCTLPTTACAHVKARIEAAFKVTGADIRNLYKQCLNQPGEYACIDHIGIDAFLNNKDVKEDLNADMGVKWELCNSTIQNQYQRDGQGSVKVYETLLREEHNLKIWIVSGTLSAFVPTLGTKKWIEQVKMNMGLATTTFWKPWFYKSINAGDYEQIRGLTFLTIRASGFYMFEDQPQLSNYIYSAFLKNTPI